MLYTPVPQKLSDASIWAEKRVRFKMIVLQIVFTYRKVTEYSPSEAASVYEKPTIRKIINVFSPDSVLSELKDDKISNTKLAEHFCNVSLFQPIAN